ncbi:putative phenylalanine--tRNA ligase [Helianthus anomalus]
MLFLLTFSFELQIFEVGDVTISDELKDVGATNHRQLVALYSGATSGFEVKLCFLNIIFSNTKMSPKNDLLSSFILFF